MPPQETAVFPGGDMEPPVPAEDRIEKTFRAAEAERLWSASMVTVPEAGAGTPSTVTARSW